MIVYITKKEGGIYTMYVINMSKKKFKTLNMVEIGPKTLNTESEVYHFIYKGKDMVFKKLNIINGNVFANKLTTLDRLDTYRDLLPKSFIVPKYLGTIHGQISGFIEDYAEGTNFDVVLNNPKIDSKIKILYLTKIGDVLEELKKIRSTTELDDIYINDLFSGNFIVTPDGNIKVVDVDSCKICDNKPFAARYMSSNSLIKFQKKYKLFRKLDSDYKIEETKEDNYMKGLGYYYIDENTDLYCYTILILNYLLRDSVHLMSMNEFYNYLNYLESIGIDKRLISCFEKILLDQDNENPKDYLFDLNTEKVVRANKILYYKKIGKKICK